MNQQGKKYIEVLERTISLMEEEIAAKDELIREMEKMIQLQKQKILKLTEKSD